MCIRDSVYTDYKKMLEEEDIDVVVIATESGYHGKHAIDVLNSGAHVMIEKPMALNLDEIDEINKLADEKNLKVCVSHQNRFNRPIQKLKRALEEGRFGKLINGTARILWTRDQHYYELAPWRGTKALDGGTLMNQCIHNIDLLQWMMNSKVVSVKSELGTFLRDIEMEDFGAILLRFENGAVGLIEGSACVYPKNLEETLSIFGETGTAVIGEMCIRDRVKMVNEGHNYIGDVVDEQLKDVVKSGKLTATTNFEDVASLDFIAIAVPTPLDLYQQPDISYVRKSTEDVARYLKKGSIVVLESTTYPGTTEAVSYTHLDVYKRQV